MFHQLRYQCIMKPDAAIDRKIIRTVRNKEKKMASILDVRGIGPALAKPLAACGIRTAEDLAVAEPADLLAVAGIGQTRALSLMAAAKAFADVEATQESKTEQKKKSKKADKAKKFKKSKKKADKKKSKDKKSKPSKTSSGKSKKSKKKKKK